MARRTDVGVARVATFSSWQDCGAARQALCVQAGGVVRPAMAAEARGERMQRVVMGATEAAATGRMTASALDCATHAEPRAYPDGY